MRKRGEREKKERERGGEKNRRTNPHFSWLPTWSTWPRLKRMASPPKLVASSLHLRRASEKSAIPVGEETDDESRTGGNSRREDHHNPGSLLRGRKTREHIEYVTRSRLRVATAPRCFPLCLARFQNSRITGYVSLRARGFRKRVILIAGDSIAAGDKNTSPDGRSASPDRPTTRHSLSPYTY